MSKICGYILTLFGLSLSLIFGLFFFSNGFLVHKAVIKKHSTCFSIQNDSLTFDDPISIAHRCLEPKARVIILIVDALKYEFVQKFYDNDSINTFHRNKVPIVYETLQKYPKNSKVFKFIADPPTTTMQRLKGITTGTLPTFIDIHSNFAASIIVEDSFINQNKKHGNIFMGDDTWINLYPDQFLRQYPAPSFDVSDLDLVDFEVNKQIFHEIDNSDWKLLIGHMLGVDHCGHKHGMHHPEMSRKLNETNFLIKKLIKKINEKKDNTILFVLGDHGMTESGDHGGETSDEVEAAMFVYSTLPLIEVEKNFGMQNYLHPDSLRVYQVDFVPTISVILGNPIPFSNIGKLILEALPSQGNENLKINDFNFVKHSLWKNVFQIQNYLETYLTENTIGDDQLNNLKDIYDKILNKIGSIQSTSNLKNFVNISSNYFNLVRKILFNAWVQFNFSLMLGGIILFLCTIFLLAFTSGSYNVQTFFKSSFLSIALQSIEPYQFIWIAVSVGVFSNSFILEENKILSYFLMTIFCFFINSEVKSIILVFTICLLIKISNHFWRYRDEQVFSKAEEFYFENFVLGKAGSIVSKNIEICYKFLAVTLLVIYFLMMKKLFFNSHNLTKNYINKVVIIFAPILIIILTSIYWIFEITYLPLLIYVIFIIVIFLIFYQPVLILSKEKESLNSWQQYFLKLNFYDRTKKDFLYKNSQSKPDSYIVYESNFVYSYCFLILNIFLSLLYILLLGFVIAPSVILMNLICLGLLFICTLDRIHKFPKQDEGQQNVSSLSIFCWFLIAEYFFYATGHQPSFSIIHWDAGFIGIDGSIQVHFIQAILIIINTFGSHITLGMTLPLLVILPFSLRRVFSSFNQIPNTSSEKIKTAKLQLLENNKDIHYQIFSVAGRYILFHAIRVLFCMLSAYINCRHLMVWNIFAPKFIFEGISLLVTIISILLSFLLLFRIEKRIKEPL